jgi:hypothetical protein
VRAMPTENDPRQLWDWWSDLVVEAVTRLRGGISTPRIPCSQRPGYGECSGQAIELRGIVARVYTWRAYIEPHVREGKDGTEEAIERIMTSPRAIALAASLEGRDQGGAA